MVVPVQDFDVWADGRSADARSRDGQDDEDFGIVGRIGPVEIDWPRSLGFFGGIGVAVAVGLIEPPLGVFIAAVPFIKMLKADVLPKPGRFVAQVFEGVAKPVGGDAEGTIRLASAATGESDPPLD
jgi:hypothetical protein